MQTQAFREYLTARQFQSAEIDSQVAFVQRIEGNLQYKMPSCSLEDLNHASTQDLVNDLIDQGENSIENLQYLARYAWAINNQDMYNALFEMLDGCEAMDNLYKKLGDYAGEDLREIIFEEMPLPPLGLSRREKSRYTYRIMHRMKLIFEETTINLNGPIIINTKEKFGKQIGGDIITNKKTFLYIKAFELAEGDSLALLKENFIANHPDHQLKVQQIKKVYTDLKVNKYVQDEISKYYNQSLIYLEKIKVDDQDG